MRSAKTNPSSNRLKAGLSDADVEKAIAKSGYPLQAIIGNRLRENFHCWEEWSYIDRDTKELRTIDLMASQAQYDFRGEQPRVRPELNLLIECKQSELPYIFFLTPDRPWHPTYPQISGLFQKNINIKTNDDRSRWSLPIGSVLSMDSHDFLKNPLYRCMSFSKCVRSSKDVVLSGTDAYQHLMLPLVKSMQFFDEAEAPPKTAAYFDCHLTFGIGVVDAPMVGVTVGDESHQSELIPWVRVFRQESLESEIAHERSRLYAIDIVHKDFFSTFLSDYLKPFVTKFSESILKHPNTLASGKGFIKGMGKDSWSNLEERLRI